MKSLYSKFVFALLLLLSGCNSGNYHQIPDEFLALNSTDWYPVLERLEFDREDISNSVFLVTTSQHCQTCLDELDYWNGKNRLDENGNNTYLIVVEKHESRLLDFINENTITMDFYQDKDANLFEHNLIPFLPVKIHFDRHGKVKQIHPIGGDHHFEHFISALNE